jgi:hypothetical protein
MNAKSIIKLCSIVGAIFIAGYLAFNLISENISRQNNDQSFCTQKCSYSQYSYFWEFTGGNGEIGFTTKDECLKYCIKQREGYAYRFISESYASVISSPPLSTVLKFLKINK